MYTCPKTVQPHTPLQPEDTASAASFKRRLLKHIRGKGSKAALARGSGQLLGIRLLGIVLGYATQILLIRWAGTEAFGAYVYVLSWVGFLAGFVAIGFPEAVLRFVPAYTAAEAWGKLRGVLRRGRQLLLAAGLGVAVVTSGILLTYDPEGTLPYTVPLLIGAWVLPLAALLRLQSRTLLAWQQVLWAALPPNILRKVLVLGGAGAMVVLGWPLTSARLVGLSGLVLLVLVLLYVLVLRGRVPETVRCAEPVYETRSWLKVSVPMLISTSLWALLSQTDLLVLGFFAGQTEVGMYSVIVRLAGMLQLFLSAVNGVAAPMFAGLVAEGRHDQLQDLAYVSSRWMFWPSLGVAVLLIVFAGPVLGLFSSVYEAGQVELMILTGAYLVNIASGLPSSLLDMAGYQNQTLRVVAWCSALNVGLNLVLIPLYGLRGAAVATGLSMILWNLWLYRVAYRHVGVHSTFLARWFSR